MDKNRRTFDESFKLNALRMVSEGRSIRSVAAELGIAGGLLQKWRKQRERKHVDSERTPKEYEAEIRELRKRAERAEMERDVLKKRFRSSVTQAARGDLHVHTGIEVPMAGTDHVCGVRRVALGVL